MHTFADSDWAYMHDTAIDLTSGTGEQVTVFLPFEAYITEFGFFYNSNSGTISTTAAEIVLDKVTASGSTELSSLLAESSKTKGDRTRDNLNTNADVVTSAPSYSSVDPSDGEYLSIAIDTQGVGGTQSVKPYIKYRPVPVNRDYDF